MPVKTVVISLTGFEEVVDSGLLSYAKANGYQETINGQPNPITYLEFARRAFGSYFAQVIAAYNSNLAAEIAREQALIASQTALDAVSISVEETN